MKIGGHPIHLMLVHFPTALFAMDWACTAWSYLTQETNTVEAGVFALAGGVLAGWGAACFGLLDWTGMPPDQKKASDTALLHGGIQLCVLLGFSLFAGKAWKNYPDLPLPGIFTLLTKSALLALLLWGNYLGGELVLRHGIGTRAAAKAHRDDN